MDRGMMIRRLLCAVSVAACAVLIGFRGGTASYMLLWASLTIPLFAASYRRIITESLRINFHISDHTVLRGERTRGTLIFSNESALPISDVRIRLTSGKIRFAETEQELVCSLKPREIKRIEFELECLHCGMGTVGSDEIVISDIFSLSRKKFKALGSIQVQPRAQHIQDLIVAPVREVERQRVARSYFGDTMPDGQLKAYLPGEDVRRIHWKASVLQGKPIMRNLIPEPKNEIVLLPDARGSLPAGEAGWVAEDSVIEGTLAIADYFLRHNIPLRVLPDEARAVNVFTPSNYLRLYDICASNFFSGDLRPDEILERDISARSGSRSYIILTWELDEDFIRRCSSIIDVGAEVTVVFIGDSPQARNLATVERRIAFYQVTAQNDIFAVLSGSSGIEGAV